MQFKIFFYVNLWKLAERENEKEDMIQEKNKRLLNQ